MDTLTHDMEVGILLQIHLILPIRDLPVQGIQRVGENWVSKETKANGEPEDLDNPIARG